MTHEIRVVTDLSSNPTLSIDHTNLSSPPSHPGTPCTLLSPTTQERTSLDYCSKYPSPTVVSSNDGASLTVPPSPSLSTHSSVHFATSLSLRDNKPDGPSGYSSSHLLRPPTNGISSHHRQASNATFSSSEEGCSSFDETSGKSGMIPLRPVIWDPTSTVLSPACTLVDTASDLPRSQAAKSDAGFSDKNVTTGGPPPDTNGDISDVGLVQNEPVDHGPFKFSPFELASLLDPKNLEALEALGGTDALLEGLGTSCSRGLTIDHAYPKSRPGAAVVASPGHDRVDEYHLSTITATPHHVSQGGVDGNSHPRLASLEERRRVFGENVLPQRATKSLLWLSLKNKVLVLLSIAAIVSLVLRLFQDFRTKALPSDELPVNLVEGVAIVIAVLFVVVVGLCNDWQKERQFKALNEKKEERGVKVIRNGVEHIIDVRELVVGDVALLEPGEIVPCDGIFLSGHNIKCDESAVTGESDAIKKESYRYCLAMKALNDVPTKGGFLGEEQHSNAQHVSAHTDCFVVSGSKVLEGVGSYVVVAVGTNSFNGRIMMALRMDAQKTPLQLELKILAELIAKIGSIAGIFLFSSLMIRFIVQLATGEPARNANQNAMTFVQILIISVALIVVAVPEGLSLVVMLALAVATKRMMKENLLVRVLGSCETMANASVVCTDKTGTLTQNVMSVVAGSIGIHAKFVRKLKDNPARTNANEDRNPRRSIHPKSPSSDFSIDQSLLNTVLSPTLCTLCNEAIAVNSTAFEDVEKDTGERVFVGSKTETALLNFAKELGWSNYKETRDAAEIVQLIPFSSDRKATGAVVRHAHGYRFYVKGASEILTKLCKWHVVVHQGGAAADDASNDEKIAEIDDVSEEKIARTTIFYASQTLHTIALCYRDFQFWPPPGIQASAVDGVLYDDIANDLTLIGIVGIENPLRDGVRKAVEDCHKAGVAVKMCTGDNVLTASSIATQCGISTAGGIIMEGPVFRQLNNAQMLKIVPRLQVLARSSPEDKRILVEKLHALGEVVCVTGDGTNDGPALKTAHVGFSMGIAGTEVAKEASDIILMDDSFPSIVKAIVWGRCVNDAVRKFLQFHISAIFTAVVITFVTAVASNSETSVLSAVQLLWINIIMDTFAALALATDPASPALLDRKPNRQIASLFTVDMYKQILLQSVYQITIILLFHFLGVRILDFEQTSESDTIVQTLVFNTFVFAQIFNSVNSRRLDRKLNIFEGMLNNWYFVVITLVEITVQVIIVFIGGTAFQVTRIGSREWGISLALGFASIFLGALIRLLPNHPFESLFILIRLLPKPEAGLPVVRPDTERNSTNVRDNPTTFDNTLGGWLRRIMGSRGGGLQHSISPPSVIAGAGWALESPETSNNSSNDSSSS